MDLKIKYKTEYENWQNKLKKSKENLNNATNKNRILIEIAAQHPLTDGNKPNSEFENRLNLGIELYNKEIKKGNYVEIYVPGSLHMYNGVSDKVSLSHAGCEYLLLNKIPKNVVHGEDLNQLYMKDLGVYNCSDECLVASKYFLDGKFGKLYSVITPEQMFRKMLFYIQFGVYPQCYTAPNNVTYHNLIDELFYSLPNVILEDNTWQGKSSEKAIKTRMERNPNLKGKNPFK